MLGPRMAASGTLATATLWPKTRVRILCILVFRFSISVLMYDWLDCSPDSAFAGKTSFKFEGASYNEDFEKFWIVDDETKQDRDRLKFGDGNGLQVSMTDQKQAPTLTSHQYLLFGKVTVRVKAAKGTGLVTTVVLKSDSGDEIDWVRLLISLLTFFPLQIANSV